MNIKGYLKSQTPFLLSFLFTYGIILLLFFAFKINTLLILYTVFLFSFPLFFFLIMDYFRKKRFYQEFFFNIENLDKAYLVLETLEEPNFYEGKLLCQALYLINKSMCENVNLLKNKTTDFTEYIEMWIHEVKIPIAILRLIAHNHPDAISKEALEQIKKIEVYVEQVLYYARQESSEKDYLINEVSLNKVVNDVILKNKDSFLESKMDLKVETITSKVYTDSKWLFFIIEQIIHNSMKYKKEKNSYIEISCLETKDKVTLTIFDNGMGIPEEDILKVFEKSFTGCNGRKKGSSTGMGLYIVKNLCRKLGHTIDIESVEGKYTKVQIAFSKNNYFEVVK